MLHRFLRQRRLYLRMGADLDDANLMALSHLLLFANDEQTLKIRRIVRVYADKR